MSFLSPSGFSVEPLPVRRLRPKQRRADRPIYSKSEFQPFVLGTYTLPNIVFDKIEDIIRISYKQEGISLVVDFRKAVQNIVDFYKRFRRETELGILLEVLDKRFVLLDYMRISGLGRLKPRVPLYEAVELPLHELLGISVDELLNSVRVVKQVLVKPVPVYVTYEDRVMSLTEAVYSIMSKVHRKVIDDYADKQDSELQRLALDARNGVVLGAVSDITSELKGIKPTMSFEIIMQLFSDFITERAVEVPFLAYNTFIDDRRIRFTELRHRFGQYEDMEESGILIFTDKMDIAKDFVRMTSNVMTEKAVLTLEKDLFTLLDEIKTGTSKTFVKEVSRPKGYTYKTTQVEKVVDVDEKRTVQLEVFGENIRDVVINVYLTNGLVIVCVLEGNDIRMARLKNTELLIGGQVYTYLLTPAVIGRFDPETQMFVIELSEEKIKIYEQPTGKFITPRFWKVKFRFTYDLLFASKDEIITKFDRLMLSNDNRRDIIRMIAYRMNYIRDNAVTAFGEEFFRQKSIRPDVIVNGMELYNNYYSKDVDHLKEYLKSKIAELTSDKKNALWEDVLKTIYRHFGEELDVEEFDDFLQTIKVNRIDLSGWRKFEVANISIPEVLVWVAFASIARLQAQIPILERLEKMLEQLQQQYDVALREVNRVSDEFSKYDDIIRASISVSENQLRQKEQLYAKIDDIMKPIETTYMELKDRDDIMSRLLVWLYTQFIQYVAELKRLLQNARTVDDLQIIKQHRFEIKGLDEIIQRTIMHRTLVFESKDKINLRRLIYGRAKRLD